MVGFATHARKREGAGMRVGLRDALKTAGLAAALAVCGFGTSPAAALDTGKLEPVRCSTFGAPFFTPVKIECGYLSVDEDRSEPGGRRIKVAVAVIRSESDQKRPDPVIYLDGGPGGHTLSNLKHFVGLETALKRDIVLFDQRGVFHSSRLCQTDEAAFRRTIRSALTADRAVAQYVDQARECHRTASRNADPRAYTTLELADDVEELRIALGVEQWNVWGVSYGTTLGLELMRQHPGGIRSITLDSVAPPSEKWVPTLVENFYDSMQMAFDRCDANFTCKAAFPDAREQLDKVLLDLRRRPLRHEGTAIDDHDLLISMGSLLYFLGGIERIPAILAAADRRDPALAEFLALVLDNFTAGIDTTVSYAVTCGDALPAPRSRPASVDQRFPVFAGSFTFDRELFQICSEIYTPGHRPVDRSPVRSSLPALVVAGTLDPVTPAKWARNVAERLENAFYFEYENASHGPTFSDVCAFETFALFMDNPKRRPVSTCQQQIAQVPSMMTDVAAALDLSAYNPGDLPFGPGPYPWQEK